VGEARGARGDRHRGAGDGCPRRHPRGSTTDALTVVLFRERGYLRSLPPSWSSWRTACPRTRSSPSSPRAALDALLGRALYYTSIDRLGAASRNPSRLPTPVRGGACRPPARRPGHERPVRRRRLIVAGVAWVSKQTVDGDATLLLTPRPGRLRCRSQRRSCSRSNCGDSEGRLRRQDFRHVRLAVKTVVAAAGMGVLRWRNALLAPATFVRSPNRRWYLLAGPRTRCSCCRTPRCRSRRSPGRPHPPAQPLDRWRSPYAFLDKLERVTLGLVAGAVVGSRGSRRHALA